MTTDRLQLWEQLKLEGLASGALGAAPDSSPWYVSLMLGVAAWVSALLALLASVVLLHFSVGEQFGLMAVLWTGSGIALLHAARTAGVFVAQLGLVAVLAGEGAAIAFFALQTEALQPTLLFSVILLLALLPLLPSATARVLNTLGACTCWVLLVSWALLGEPRDWRDAQTPGLGLALLVWALCWLPVLGAALAIVANETQWMARSAAPLLRALLIGLLVALALATPLSNPLAGLLIWQGGAISDGSRSWLALWPLLSLFTALIAAGLAFHQRSRSLLAVCLFGVLLHVGHFYLQLGVGLLEKSLVMLLMGAGLLLAARYGRRPEITEARA
jgi:hypothetical protein